MTNHLLFLSVPNYCSGSTCSHSCLLVPNGYRCSCPDGVISINGLCSSAFEAAKSQPYRCQCKNGGSCAFSEKDNTKIICKCLENFEGSHCEEHVPRSRINGQISSLFASVILPILIVLLTLLIASSLYVFFKKRNL